MIQVYKSSAVGASGHLPYLTYIAARRAVDEARASNRLEAPIRLKPIVLAIRRAYARRRLGK